MSLSFLTKSDHGTLVQELLFEQGIDLRLVYEVSDFLAAIGLVQEGVGITIIPESISVAANLSNVRVHRLEPVITVTLSLIAPTPQEASLAVRAFTEIAKTVYHRV